MSYVILKGRWCDIIFLNVHAPTEDKIDDIKDSFYEELEHVFDKFQKYPMKILLGDFNAKEGREEILKPTIGNESLHEISNDNGVRVVNFATSKNLTVKSTMFPHYKEFYNLYSSPSIIRMIKTRRMRWARSEGRLEHEDEDEEKIKEKVIRIKGVKCEVGEEEK
ncbi:hypothetical protein B7P43_G12386 [Cryptotermes secundus]|uniref:Endonuclease/exonuclease/phosphatase domain-containing protein n=1 Tax=Cryptotermes secundus TaxID=105785 RepID=A0A2J7RBN0_9NEOP|nr:hypothetical protein B7P43_G12386 [Cryptotermes secundus]